MILVAYASEHGSTADIARHIAERLTSLGKSAEAKSVEETGDVGRPEGLILGSAVYGRSWMKEALAFAQENREALSGVPVWLFSSGPIAGIPKDPDPKQLPELEEALKPRGHRVFGGAMDTSKLGFMGRLMAKAIKAQDGDFRDWDQIASWADELAAALDTTGAR